MTRPSSLILTRRLAETLAFATAGGAALGLPGLPAGWLSGAILFTAAAALAQRPVYVPQGMARVTFVVLGITLGAAITPDTAARIATWPVSMFALAVAMSCSTLAISVYLVRVHGWDSMSALFAAAPGALSQALALAADTSADLRSVAIVQSLRVLVLTVVLPLIMAAFAMTGAPPEPMPPLRESLGELALLIIVPTAVAMIAYRVRLPGGLIVGAMLASGLLHGFGVVRINLPPIVITVAFVALGALIGSRFLGMDLARLRELLRASVGALVVGMTVAGLFAAATAWMLSLNFADVLIAYAPGGLEPMTILAFALHLDPAFVGAHHLWRFLYVSVMMPLAVAYVARRRQMSEESDTKD